MKGEEMSAEPGKAKAGNADAATGGIARSAGAVSAAVMCSRLLGLVREQIFAALFGAGYDYDAFVVAFRIPNLLRDLFGEGALSAAFVTVFTEYDSRRSPRETWELAGNVIVFIALLLGLLTLVGMVLATPIVNLLAPGFHAVAGKTALTTLLTRIMLPFLLFISLSAVVMGMLNTKGRFFIPALASSFFNLGSIIGGVGLALLLPRFGLPAIVGMALGTLVGGLLQLLMQLPSLKRSGFRFLPRLDLRDPGLHRILLLMLPAVVGLSATQINIFVNTNFAASCAQGSVSWLNYAFRMVQLPIGIFGVAISIAAMPVLARHAAAADMVRLRTTYTSSLIMVLALTIPATVGLILLAEPIIRLIFEHGEFTSLDTARTAEALVFYSLGLFAYGAVKIMVPVFYALGTTRFPVIGSFLAVGANIVIITLTIDTFQHRAIALSTSCAMTLNFFFLGTVLYRKLGGYPLGHLLVGLMKIAIAAAVMAAGLLLARPLLAALPEETMGGRLAAVLLPVTGGALLYGVSVSLLGIPELKVVGNGLLRRLRCL